MGRNKVIKKYIQNKSVLDVGFLGEEKDVDFSPLHKFIITHAKEVWGLDIDKERLKKLKKKGYKVIYDDAQKLTNLSKFNIKFDAIVAGEVIEHLDNPGLFLERIKRFLNHNGVLIITTPNLLSLRYMIRHTLAGIESAHWKDREKEIKYGHVIGFSKSLLENLLLRKNYHIIELGYSIKDEYIGIKRNLEKIISYLFPRFSPSLIAVCKLREDIKEKN